MSIHAKRAALVLVVVAAIGIYRAFRGVSVAGSAGVGAVSVGVSEALLELVAIVCIFFYWRSRRQRSGSATRS